MFKFLLMKNIYKFKAEGGNTSGERTAADGDVPADEAEGKIFNF